MIHRIECRDGIEGFRPFLWAAGPGDAPPPTGKGWHGLKHLRGCTLLLLCLWGLAASLSGCYVTAAEDDLRMIYNPIVYEEEAPLPEPARPEVLRLPWVPDDSLNPYTLQTRSNYDITRLLYDSLLQLDEQFTPQPVLAESVQLEGTLCLVTLRDGLTFDDGAPITAADVVYSLETARASALYGPSLSHVAGASVLSNTTLSIELSTPDRNFAHLLTFPIIREGSAADANPVGRGRYRYNPSNRTLTLNEDYPQPGGCVKLVVLVRMEESEAASFYLKTGEIDYIYTEPGEEAQVLSSGSKPVDVNRLVFLGVNGGRRPTSQPSFRLALSLALDRQGLVQQAFGGRAVASKAPFHPLFWQPEQEPSQVEIAREEANALLDGLGYERQADGMRHYQGAPLRLTLVAVEGREALARQLQEQLAQVGVELQLTMLPYSDYLAALAASSFDLYIGEIQLPYNMDIGAILRPGSAAGAGVAYDEALLESYEALMAGEIGYADFYGQFEQAMPFVPLCYRQGAVSFSRNFYADIVATERDIFYNIGNW